MEQVFIDLSKCKNSKEMHQELKEKLQFPSFYGANSDALWDCIQDYCDEPMEIVIKKPIVQTADIIYEFKLISEVFDDYVKKYSFSKVIFIP